MNRVSFGLNIGGCFLRIEICVCVFNFDEDFWRFFFEEFMMCYFYYLMRYEDYIW